MIKHMKMGQLGVGNTKKLNRSCWQQLTIDLKKKKKKSAVSLLQYSDISRLKVLNIRH